MKQKTFAARLYQLRPDQSISFDLIMNGVIGKDSKITARDIAGMFAKEVVTYAKKRVKDIETKGYTNLNGIKASHPLYFYFEGQNFCFDLVDSSIKMRLRAYRKGQVVKESELKDDITFVIENMMKEYKL